MIDRRLVLIGGLAGLALPGLAGAQGPNGPGPAGAGNAGAGGVRNRPQANERRGGGAADQRADSAGSTPQPARIQALILSQSYRGTPAFTLANTGRDAALIARSFQQLRFDHVWMHSDGAAADTMARIAGYLDAVASDTIALVYVAGHGLEIGGENLLMLEGGTAFLSLQALVQALQQRAGVTILFLDACRNNPFAALATSGGQVSRAVALGQDADIAVQTIGLDELRGASAGGAPGRLRAFSLQGSGVKIVFSTDPANVAFDGARPDSRNGPFALALARRIREPVSLDDIVSLTTGDVIRATRRVQSPWSQGSIGRPIFLSGRRRRRQATLR